MKIAMIGTGCSSLGYSVHFSDLGQPMLPEFE